MCNPVLQLTKKTWPLTLAAVAALVANLVLVDLPFFSADIDGLAQAFAISLGVGFVAAAATAFHQGPIRPAARDMIVVAAIAGVMGLVLRPLNAIHPPVLAAVLSVIFGGAILATRFSHSTSAVCGLWRPNVCAMRVCVTALLDGATDRTRAVSARGSNVEVTLEGWQHSISSAAAMAGNWIYASLSHPTGSPSGGSLLLGGASLSWRPTPASLLRAEPSC